MKERDSKLQHAAKMFIALHGVLYCRSLTDEELMAIAVKEGALSDSDKAMFLDTIYAYAGMD